MKRMPELNADGVSIKGCSIIYAPAGQAGEYAPLACNPYRGCGHGCTYCVVGDTLISMSNGTTKRMADIRIGDKIIGVSREERNGGAWSHRYAQATVLNKLETLKEAFEIILENDNSVICSGDHRWLTDRGWKYTTGKMSGAGQRPYLTINNQIRGIGSASKTPAETSEYKRGYLAGMIRGDATMGRYDYSGTCQRSNRKHPQITDVQHHFRLALKDVEALHRTKSYLESFGVQTHDFVFANGDREPLQAIRNNSRSAFDTIHALIVSNPTSSEWMRGWLAGIFDAEGSFGNVVRISNTNEEMLAITLEGFASLGMGAVREDRQDAASTIRLRGGLDEVTRFFQITAPAIKRKCDISDTAVSNATRIIEIRPLGKIMPMFDITTSTETFIANGLVSHNCYVPAALRMSREEFDSGAKPREGFLEKLEKDAYKYYLAGIREQVFLSFTTDVFNPFDQSLTRPTIEMIQRFGMGVCTLTKGGSRALPYLDLFRPDRDCFASTLTSLDDRISREWEPEAALPCDRIATLRRFHEAGIYTWVSLEPVYDVETALQIIRETATFVNLYKIGRINYHRLTRLIDWKSFTHRVLALTGELGCEVYIKKDLQPYLPDGFVNPLRRVQASAAEVQRLSFALA